MYVLYGNIYKEEKIVYMLKNTNFNIKLYIKEFKK